MTFAHIHCSSRFDRPASDLETDLDNWMARASLITLTEVNNDNRSAKLQEKGWGHYNASLGGGRDDCAIAWSKDRWRQNSGDVTKLQNSPIPGRSSSHLYAASVVLHSDEDKGLKLLVSVTHFPAAHGDTWGQRKVRYLHGLQVWSTHVNHQARKHQVDGVLVCADFNVNLKANWFRDILMNRWGKNYRMGWTHFPTDGGSRHGGPNPPAGAPGKGSGDSIIDGSLIRGLKVTEDPNLMNRVRSSDHRPYEEHLAFLGKNEKPDDTPAHGDTKPGDEWWGFGDTLNDEIYALNTATGDAGGEVL